MVRIITSSLRSHLDHMDLKNWAFSLFDSGRPLNTYGFKNRRATPIIESGEEEWTPDVMAWSEKIVLIIECKTGAPSEDHLTQAKRYADIPESAIASWTGLPNLSKNAILLYFKDKIDSNPASLETLRSKLSLEKNIVVWNCERGSCITLIYGSHSDSKLDSLLRGGLDLSHFPARQIEIQPDSHTIFLEKLLFTRLWERAFRFKDTRFTIGTAREILEKHNYGSRKNRDKRLSDAIRAGEKHSLCFTEQTGTVWQLNCILESNASITNYLKKLQEILKYPELQNFSSDL